MSESTREERKKAIKKSIKLVGWLNTSERIKTKEDREIFMVTLSTAFTQMKALRDEISLEFRKRHKAQDDAKLKKHGISF